MNQPIQKFKANEALFLEGSKAENLFIIRSGVVSIRRKKGAGFVELARAYSGEVLGEVAFFDRKNRSASAVALTEVEAMQIQFSQLDHLYKSIPDYLRAIMSSMADRLRKSNDLIRRLQDETFVDSDEDADTSAIVATTQPIPGSASVEGGSAPSGSNTDDKS